MNSNCKKCFGSGFINSNVAPSIEKPKGKKIKQNCMSLKLRSIVSKGSRRLSNSID